MLPLSTKSLARFCFLKVPLFQEARLEQHPNLQAFILSQFSSPTRGQELFPKTLKLRTLWLLQKAVNDLSTLWKKYKEMNGLGESYDDGKNAN